MLIGLHNNNIDCICQIKYIHYITYMYTCIHDVAYTCIHAAAYTCMIIVIVVITCSQRCILIENILQSCDTDIQCTGHKGGDDRSDADVHEELQTIQQDANTVFKMIETEERKIRGESGNEASRRQNQTREQKLTTARTCKCSSFFCN